MTAPEMALVSDEIIGVHRYVVLDCRASDRDAMVDGLAELIAELYVGPVELAERLLTAATGLDEVADMREVRALVERLTAATIPDEPPPRQPPWLQLQRNELAEILAYLAAEAHFGTLVPAKRVREKETPRLPSRGMDMLGLDVDPELTLVLSEAKASEDLVSPPAVVEDGPSSLRAQIRAFQEDTEKILVELGWAERHSPYPLNELVGRAMFMLVRGALPSVVFPVLLRPIGAHQMTDPGCFRDDAASFSPAAVRFCVVRVAESLAGLATDAYAAARIRRAG